LNPIHRLAKRNVSEIKRQRRGSSPSPRSASGPPCNAVLRLFLCLFVLLVHASSRLCRTSIQWVPTRKTDSKNEVIRGLLPRPVDLRRPQRGSRMAIVRLSPSVSPKHKSQPCTHARTHSHTHTQAHTLTQRNVLPKSAQKQVLKFNVNGPFSATGRSFNRHIFLRPPPRQVRLRALCSFSLPPVAPNG
jgi:hypothetical protein